jgi:hypothetical protein
LRASSLHSSRFFGGDGMPRMLSAATRH